MSLSLANDYEVVDNTETVTYYAKTGDGSQPYPTGQSVPFVLRRTTDKAFMSAGQSLAKGESVFHVWVSQLGDIVPKVNDRIVDPDSSAWTVKTVQLQTLNTRYRLTCVKEVS